MSRRLDGKISLVTGAGGGIGRAAALLFAQEGSSVVVADLREAEGRETVALIERQGGAAVFIATDVANAAHCQAMSALAMDRFGRLDIAFNNAGIGGVIAPLPDIAEAEWDRVIAVNLKSIYLSMKYQIPAMRQNGGGVILNTSSVAGLIGNPADPAYCAAKHGVIGLTRATALRHISENIRINAICPGPTDTGMLREVLKMPGVREQVIDVNPIHRLADPMEIAHAALFLVSDDSSYVVGHAMAVEGGVAAQ